MEPTRGLRRSLLFGLIEPREFRLMNKVSYKILCTETQSDEWICVCDKHIVPTVYWNHILIAQRIIKGNNPQLNRYKTIKATQLG